MSSTLERQRLSQHGRLASGAREILQLLREADDSNAEHAVSRALTVSRSLAEFDTRFTSIAKAIDESLIALREGIESAERYEADLEADPQRQEWVEQRLAAIESIARKHRVEPAALGALHAQLAAEFQQLDTLEASLEQIEKKLAQLQTQFRAACAKLSAARVAAANTLSRRISDLMQTLGMPGGVFEIAVRALQADAASAHGADEVEFLVSANPGQPPRPLAKVASGGELSRISLAIQVAAAQSDALPCLVFDEVDAGVGGGVAEIVGRQLRTLGERAQVLCVTHLPQVASQAHAHVRVTKLTDGKTTRTALTVLGTDERVEEIARMLGGVSVTDKAREHAAEMLRAPGAGRKKSARRLKSRARKPDLQSALLVPGRAIHALAAAVQDHRVILDLELQLRGDGALPVLDARVHELFDLAAVKTDDMVVVLALVQLEHRGRTLEVMARDEAGRLELRQHPVHGCKANVLVRLEQMLINVFRAHVARRRGAENLQNLEPRQRDLEPRLAKVAGFHVLHSWGPGIIAGHYRAPRRCAPTFRSTFVPDK